MATNDPNPRCRDCPVRHASVFRDAPESVHEALDAARELRHYRPGDRIFTDGDPVDAVYCVLDGDVELRARRDGEEMPLSMAQPGMLIGYREPERLGRYIVSAIARTDSVACRIPLEVLQQQMHAAPVIMIDLMRSLASRAEDIEQRL